MHQPQHLAIANKPAAVGAELSFAATRFPISSVAVQATPFAFLRDFLAFLSRKGRLEAQALLPWLLVLQVLWIGLSQTKQQFFPIKI